MTTAPGARARSLRPFSRLHAALVALACLASVGPAAAGERGPRLAPGTWIHVDGEADERGAFVPRAVRLQNPLSKPLLRGRIAASEQGGRRLVLLNYTISVDSSTTLYRGAARTAASFGELAPGVLIEAKVVRRGKRIVATRIRIDDAAAGERRASIDAPVEQADDASGRIVMLGAAFAIPAGEIADERTAAGQTQGPVNVLRREDDEQQVRPLQLGSVTVGGRFETTYLDRADFDLNNRRPDRNDRLESRLQMVAAAALTPTFHTYAKVSSTRRVPIADRRGPAAGSSDVRVEEAYLTITEPGGLPLTANVGRQRFRDAREWFFDEYLDAVRVKTDVAGWTLEAAIARGLFRPEAGSREARDAQHVIVSAATRVGDASVSAVLIHRRGDVSPETPTWIGSSVSGRVTPHGRYWSVAALRRGHAGAVRLGGWALDLGTTWRLPVGPGPSLSAGFASGSGDARPGDGIDTTFRQTELHDNKARFGGLKRFASYGEVLRPDLSDLSIVTVGTTTTLRKWSVDVIYHRYRRGAAPRWAGHLDIKAVPEGSARHLGDEIDTVVALQVVRGVDLSLIVGVFQPGAAFAGNRSPAVVWRPQVRFYF
jgi:hypothetical protein